MSSSRCAVRTSAYNRRDQLREQQQLSEEIAQAITNNAMTDQLDEDALEQELEGLEQETMDERMLKTGTVPVGDRINQLPTAANGERKPTGLAITGQMLTV